VKGADDVAKVVQDALTAALKPMQDKLEASEAARAAAQKRSDEAMLRTAVGERFLKVGGKSKALDFIVGQAGNVFVVEDGQVKAKPNQFSAAKPGESIGIDEWLQGQAKENDFAFEPSGGGGASAGNGNGGAPRPGVRRVVNPTPEELGRFKFVAGKGLVDRDGQVVEIAEAS
jgi:hypothetical protein